MSENVRCTDKYIHFSSKSLQWNFFRMLQQQFLNEHSRRKTPDWNIQTVVEFLQKTWMKYELLLFKGFNLIPVLVLRDHLHRRRSVCVAEHGVKGMSQVVGLSAVVLLRQRQQEGQSYQQEQEELEGQRHPENTAPEQRPARCSLRIRREGTGSSVSVRPAHTAHTFTTEF